MEILKQVWEFIKANKEIFTLIGIVSVVCSVFSLRLAYLSYKRNKRIDKEAEASKAEAKRKEEELKEEKKFKDELVLKEKKLNFRPNFTPPKQSGVSTTMVVEDQITYIIYNFGKGRAVNFSLVNVNGGCSVNYQPRNTNFDIFKSLTLSVIIKPPLTRENFKCHFEFYYEDELGTKYKQTLDGDVYGYKMSQPIELI